MVLFTQKLQSIIYMAKVKIFKMFFYEFLTKNISYLVFPKLALYICAVLDVEPNRKSMINTRKITRTQTSSNNNDFWLGFVLVMVAIINILNAIAIIW